MEFATIGFVSYIGVEKVINSDFRYCPQGKWIPISGCGRKQLQKNIQEAGEEKFWELFEVDIAGAEENRADVKKFVEKLIG